jgi:hypothetical protein
LYYKSKISPQNSYIFRYIYDYGALVGSEKTSVALPIDYTRWYDLIAQTLDIKYAYTENDQRIIMWLVVEFAKIYKTTLGGNSKGVLSLEDFVNLGLLVLVQKPEIKLEQEKLVQKNYIQHIWCELLAQKRLQRHYIIYKDATASAIQLLTVYLTPTNEEIAKHTNLKSTSHWYDTYHYVIQLFLKRNKIDGDSEAYFNRNNLKKTIMTYNYSATLHTC